MIKLTFKQYLESKEQLRRAIANTPVTVVEYCVKKYCSLPVGETEEDKQIIGLKPKHRVIVEWKYEDVHNPTPVSIKFIGLQSIDEFEQYSTFWTSQKLNKWLVRHTDEENSNEFKA